MNKILIFTVFIFQSFLMGQAQFVTITLTNGMPYKDVIIDEINEDSLIVKGLGNEYHLCINDIETISVKNKGASAFGFCIGGALGFAFVYLSPCEDDFLGFCDVIQLEVATVSGLIGGGIGALVGAVNNEREYNLQELSNKKKRKVLLLFR